MNGEINCQLLREITPLTQSDCFSVFSRYKTEFDFPLHFHDEIELNFIKNAAGAKRVIGDHVEEIQDIRFGSCRLQLATRLVWQ